MRNADELARAVAETMLAREGTGPAWGLELESAREGYARVAMTIRPDMLNGHGTAHGGMIFALADSAFAYACNSRNATTVAQHAAITFLAPAREGDRLTAEAQERAGEGRSGVWDVTVRCGEQVVAVFQGLSRTVGGTVV
jgi:acyl-CoA thioesterase